MDFFVVPTATFRLLYGLVVMNHERRKVVHFNITDSPTPAWTAQQIVNAFPYDTAPKYLLRDRDSIYGSSLKTPVTSKPRRFVDELNVTSQNCRKECTILAL